VVAVDGSTVTLGGQDARFRLDRARALHLQHAYASTVHSAQGLTSARVLVDANTRSLSSNRAVFYVAISRARHHVTLFTDDASKLASAMSREPKKFAALELRDDCRESDLLKGRLARLPSGARAAKLATNLKPREGSRDAPVRDNALRAVR
jgi:ATP-dependent exoDNAse (exonuclease V) alpha subunit